MSDASELMPRYLKTVGAILLVVAVLNAADYSLQLATSAANSRVEIVWNLVMSSLAGLGGFALFTKRRWGWAIGMLLAAIWITVGIVVAILTFEDVSLAPFTAGVIVYEIPALLLLLTLLNRRSRRWFLQRETDMKTGAGTATRPSDS